MSTADLQRHGYENMEQLLNWEWFNRFGLGDVAYRTASSNTYKIWHATEPKKRSASYVYWKSQY